MTRPAGKPLRRSASNGHGDGLRAPGRAAARWQTENARRAPVIIGGWRGPGWRVFDAHPGHVGQVRAWISAAITRHDCPADPADAALAVSELFTNAVVHGPEGGRVLVGYCLWSQGARLVVCDGGGSGEPELRPVTSQAQNGRGLHVVEAVTARWGSFRLAGNLVAWCDLGQRMRAPAGD